MKKDTNAEYKNVTDEIYDLTMRLLFCRIRKNLSGRGERGKVKSLNEGPIRVNEPLDNLRKFERWSVAHFVCYRDRLTDFDNKVYSIEPEKIFDVATNV